MLYRKMGPGAPELSILGFGCMRLPMQEGGRIDEEHAAKMLRYALDHGVNYVDTAYPYHHGESERFLGRFFSRGDRAKVHLATKLPSWLVKSRADMDRLLDEQLGRLQTDHIDYYLLHGLNAHFWPRLAELGVTGFLDAALADGRIRHAGFSFHDILAPFKTIVDGYDWTFAQIQYNFMDEQYQAGTEGLRYAAAKGLGIVVMEPIRGGLLARDIDGVREIWQKAKNPQPPSAWALRWVWNHPEVSVVLSGMSSLEQMRENVAWADSGRVGSLTPEELALYAEVKEELEKRIAVPCTDCKYCLPCPHGVEIPECFEMLNRGHIYGDAPQVKFVYNFYLGGFFDGAPHYASVCQDCGECEAKCPQGLPIREHLKAVRAYFGK